MRNHWMVLVRSNKEGLRVHAVPMHREEVNGMCFGGAEQKEADVDRAVRSVMDNQVWWSSTPVAVAYGNDEFRHLKKVLVEPEECESCGQALSFPEFKWARGKAVRLEL